MAENVCLGHGHVLTGWSDKTRAASPLTLAHDAVLIDTTNMPIDEVVQRVLDLARERSA